MATEKTPSYYLDDSGLDLLDKWLKTGQKEKFFGFVVGCIEKYIARYNGKNGIEDLEKAKNYIDRLIEGVKYFDEVERKQNFSSIEISDDNFHWSKDNSLDSLLQEQQEGMKKLQEDINKDIASTSIDNEEDIFQSFIDLINERNEEIDEQMENERLENLRLVGQLANLSKELGFDIDTIVNSVRKVSMDDLMSICIDKPSIKVADIINKYGNDPDVNPNFLYSLNNFYN